jgi:hypothetical protein
VIVARPQRGADGAFLQRPELDDLWDVRGRYERRYFPRGQRLYLAAVDPRANAQIVVGP